MSLGFRIQILVLALLCVAGTVRAQAEDDALVAAGLELRREGRDGEALEQFRRALAVRPAPRTLAQIALAEQALGQWLDAEKDLREALAQQDDPWIASHEETLREALATVEKHLGTLEVRSNLEGSELWLNGAVRGKLPVPPLRVVSGAIEIELRHADHPPVKRSVVVPEGRSVTEHIEFVINPGPPAPPGPIEAAPPRSVDSSSQTQSPAFQRTLAWVTLGSAGALLGGSIVAQIVAQNGVTRYNDDERCFYGSLSRDQRCGAYRGRAETAQAIATIGYVSAGTLGLASAVLFLTLPGDASKRPVAIWIDAEPRIVGVRLQGQL